MPWAKGLVSGEVTADGRIIAQTRGLQVMENAKPPDPAAAIAEGLDVQACQGVNARLPGIFKFTAHFGGATAMLVPWSALTLLDERRMARLLGKYYGYMPEAERRFPEWVAVMHVRNTGAPARQNDAEPSGGMAEITDLLADQVEEMVEMGVYRDDGWVRFRLPAELASHQETFIREQEYVWHILKPDFPHYYGANLELLSVGRDQFNSRAGILAAGPVGDFSFTVVTKLHLRGTGWKFVDLETMQVARQRPDDPWGEDRKTVPMRRHMVVIAPRLGGGITEIEMRRSSGAREVPVGQFPGRSPVVFQLNADGALDDFGHHFVLDGENRELAVTHIGRAVLEALGWLQ